MLRHPQEAACSGPTAVLGTPPKQGVLVAEERRDPGSEDWPRDQRAPGLFSVLTPTHTHSCTTRDPRAWVNTEVPGGLKNLLWDCVSGEGSKPGAGRLSLHTQGRPTQVTMPFHASVLSFLLRKMGLSIPQPSVVLSCPQNTAWPPESPSIRYYPHHRRHRPCLHHHQTTTPLTVSISVSIATPPSTPPPLQHHSLKQKWLTQWSTLTGLSNTNILCFCCSE